MDVWQDLGISASALADIKTDVTTMQTNLNSQMTALIAILATMDTSSETYKSLTSLKTSLTELTAMVAELLPAASSRRSRRDAAADCTKLSNVEIKYQAVLVKLTSVQKNSVLVIINNFATTGDTTVDNYISTLKTYIEGIVSSVGETITKIASNILSDCITSTPTAAATITAGSTATMQTAPPMGSTGSHVMTTQPTVTNQSSGAPSNPPKDTLLKNITDHEILFIGSEDEGKTEELLDEFSKNFNETIEISCCNSLNSVIEMKTCGNGISCIGLCGNGNYDPSHILS